MKTRFVVILLVLLAGILYYADEKACNKAGSVAEKINWAGHNCPR